MKSNDFTKTNTILMFYLRKDRLFIIFWFIALLICTVGIIAYFPSLYSSQAEREAIVATMANPAMIAMAGPIYGESPFTIAQLAAQQMLFFTTILAIVMNINLALKNTRSQEDDGLSEMINSFSIGRHSSIMAVSLELILINFITGLAIAFGLYFIGIEGVDLTGALIYAGAMMLVGLVFGCTTVLFAQIAGNLRSAQFMSYIFFGLMYLLRATTDISNPNLSWISPVAWANKTEVFVNNRVFPLLLCIVFSIIFVIISLYFNKVRDLGSGIIKNKKGKLKALPIYCNPLGLSIKLESFSFVLWLIIIIVLAASYGSVFGDIDSFLTNETLVTVLQPDGKHSLALSFIPILTFIIAIFICIPCLSIIMRLLKEEKNGRIEQLYALPVSRTNFLLIHTFIAVALAILGILLGAVCSWYVSSLVMNDAIPLASFIEPAIAYIAGVIFMISLAILMLGWFPKLIKLLWLYLVFGFMSVYFGGLLQLPKIVKALSPFGLIPRTPIEPFDYTLFVLMIIGSILITIIGIIGYNRRDIIK